MLNPINLIVYLNYLTMERTTTRPGTELRNVVSTTFLKSEQARITRKFNQKLKRIYRQEPNLAERLRILKQRRADLNMLVKKNRSMFPSWAYNNTIRHRNRDYPNDYSGYGAVVFSRVSRVCLTVQVERDSGGFDRTDLCSYYGSLHKWRQYSHCGYCRFLWKNV